MDTRGHRAVGLWAPGLAAERTGSALKPMQLFVLGYGQGKGLGRPADYAPLREEPTGSVSGTTTATLGASGATTATLGASGATTATLRRARLVRAVHGAAESAEGSEDGEDGDRGEHVPVDEHPDAFASAMRLPVRIGQVFSVLPADASSGSWSCRGAAYAAVVSGGLSALAVLSAVKQFGKERPKLVDTMVVVFYLMAATMSLLFVRLARYWRALVRAFRAQERQHGVCPGLRAKMRLVTCTLLGVAFVEHSLSEMNNVLNLRIAFANASTFSECLEIYVASNYPMVLIVMSYSASLSPFLFFLNFVATFVWNFTDLFVILMAVAVASRFKLLQESIAGAIGNTVAAKASAMPPPVLGTGYWRSARRAYNAISKLARLVDQALNIQLFVSFLNNLYFVCMQLLRGFADPSLKWYSSVYILFSFAFLVARTAAVSLLAATVHENSRSVQDVLYCVSSEDYNEEVYRFLIQVTSEVVALSGLNMFKVTRGLLLTVAGTILTYEVVLVQLH